MAVRVRKNKIVLEWANNPATRVHKGPTRDGLAIRIPNVQTRETRASPVNRAANGVNPDKKVDSRVSRVEEVLKTEIVLVSLI